MARRGIGEQEESSPITAFLVNAGRAAPVLLTALFVLIGYRHLAPGVAHTGDYHAYAFREMRYSDII